MLSNYDKGTSSSIAARTASPITCNVSLCRHSAWQHPMQTPAHVQSSPLWTGPSSNCTPTLLPAHGNSPKHSTHLPGRNSPLPYFLYQIPNQTSHDIGTYTSVLCRAPGIHSEAHHHQTVPQCPPFIPCGEWLARPHPGRPSQVRG